MREKSLSHRVRYGFFAIAGLGLVALGWLGIEPAAAAASSNLVPVYTDALASGFQDWSWATHSLSETTVVHSGTAGISLQANAYQGLQLVQPSPLAAGQYSGIDFWVYGSGAGGQLLLASLYYADGTGSTPIKVESLLPGGALPAATWTHVQVSFSALGAPANANNIQGIVIQGGAAGTQPVVYLDDISLVAAASSPPVPPPTQGQPVYTDALQGGYQDWSWATHKLVDTTVVHSGTAAISFQANAYQGLSFEAATPFAVSQYSGFGFWVYGSGAGGQNLLANVTLADGSSSANVAVEGLIPGGTLPPATWTYVQVPFASLGVASGSIAGLVIQGGNAGTQPTVYIDDVSLIAATPPPPPPPPPTTAQLLPVYTDQLMNGYQDWSWATHSLTQTAIVHSGADAILFQANAYGGLQFVAPAASPASQFTAIDFWVYGSGTGGQQLLTSLYYADGTGSTAVKINPYLPGNALQGNTWTHVQVPFSAMGVASTASVLGFVLQSGAAATQPTVYIDDVSLVLSSSAPVPPPMLPFGYALPNDANALALTFDDGPDDYGNALALAQVLVQYNVPATFFINADNWSAISTDVQAQQALQYIHAHSNLLTIGNHTDHHLHLGTLPYAQAWTEMNQVEVQLRQVVGDPNLKLTQVRAPFGEPYQNPVPDPNIQCMFAQYGVHIGWNIDPDDYDCAPWFPATLDPNSQQLSTATSCVTNVVMTQLNAGQRGVVLLHSAYPSTVTAVQQLIPQLQAQGYHFVSIETMVQSVYGKTSAQLTPFTGCTLPPGLPARQ